MRQLGNLPQMSLPAPPFVGLVKVYPRRGQLQQYRLDRSVSFPCIRCGQVKTSKLVATYGADVTLRICNGCYGWLLSVYELKHGSLAIADRAEALSQALLLLASESEARDAARRARLRADPVGVLDRRTVRFMGTSLLIAERLADVDVDWSVAVIGLCKALELELVLRLIDPLRGVVETRNLTVEREGPDPELSFLARYLLRPQLDHAPELGWIARFMTTVIRSERRAASSPLIQGFRARLLRMPGSLWLTSPEAAAAVSEIAQTFRNPAAHTQEMSRVDFDRCQGAIIGQPGLLWMLVEATATRRGR